MKSHKIFQAFALSVPDIDNTPPTLSARGDFELAQHIVDCARKHGIPIVERPQVCASLEALDLDQQIPVALFKVAAAILAEVGALTSVGQYRPCKRDS